MKRDLKIIYEIIDRYNRDKNSLTRILQDIIRDHGSINENLIELLSEELDIPGAKIEGVLTFYSFLNEKKGGKYTIRICNTISCDLAGKKDIIKALERQTGALLGSTSKDKLFTLKECSCLGMCDQGPALLINSVLLSKIKITDIKDIIKSCRDGSFSKDYGHRYISTIHKKEELYYFLSSSKSNFSNYIDRYPTQIIKEITDAGLKGRGGAGFPTGLKWQKASMEQSEEKYIICNADEGEPGTFKDRFLLDNYSDRVIEGMIVGAKAIGATKGIIYLRGEYCYLVDKIRESIDRYDFDIRINLGSGSYVCGEETALIESLEGNRGEARNRPPYPATFGYLGKPTVVNNVETFIDVCFIMEKGSNEFKKFGTRDSNGTKFFSISGDLDKPGIYELPLGITIEELLEELDVTDIKSVQLGGASGINISENDFNKRIAFEAAPSGGSIILFNRDRNMLEVARNFMDFFVNESCGQCIPCREGSIKLLNGLDDILNRDSTYKYLNKLIKLGNSIMSSSKCGLGQVCAKSFISIVENNQNQISEYIKE